MTSSQPGDAGLKVASCATLKEGDDLEQTANGKIYMENKVSIYTTYYIETNMKICLSLQWHQCLVAHLNRWNEHNLLCWQWYINHPILLVVWLASKWATPYHWLWTRINYCRKVSSIKSKFSMSHCSTNRSRCDNSKHNGIDWQWYWRSQTILKWIRVSGYKPKQGYNKVISFKVLFKQITTYTIHCILLYSINTNTCQWCLDLSHHPSIQSLNYFYLYLLTDTNLHRLIASAFTNTFHGQLYTSLFETPNLHKVFP